MSWRPADKQPNCTSNQTAHYRDPLTPGYNGKVTPLPNFFEVISNRITIEGFLVLDVKDRYGEIVQKIAGWIKEGKVKLDEAETVVPTKIEDIPQTWQRLFRGENRGKLVTQLVA